VSQATSWLPAALAILGSAVAGWFTYRSASSAAHAAVQVKNVEVDAAAYNRARELYESGIKQLEEQLQRIRSDLAQERDVSNSLRNQINQLEDTVAMMRRQLLLAGIDVAQQHLAAGARPPSP
jgi:septal ring factor EnvC (AmiA/AmiB activator)